MLLSGSRRRLGSEVRRGPFRRLPDGSRPARLNGSTRRCPV